MVFDEEKIDDLIAHHRLEEASAALTIAAASRSLRAGVYAIDGRNRALARTVDVVLLGCRSASEVATHYASSNQMPDAYAHLVAGAILAWSADAEGTYAALRAAYDRAVAERRFHLAVAARERLAHHAMLFGDVARAHEAIEEAIAVATSHGLARWLPYCLAAAARYASDAGDVAVAEALLERGRAAAASPPELALFAATGAQLAVELGDDGALQEWTSPAILETALRCELAAAAVAATIAGLIAAGACSPGTPNATALRRALLQSEDAANAVELFSLAAQYGDIDEARFAVDALGATVAPARPYLQAHQLLARAYLLLRSGERAASIDCAGDAARAFSAIGLRRWTNDAMRLLVSKDATQDRRARGRSSSAVLTGREEQVANLIRRGARNREVAIALQISEHTVERHVSSILGRLGLRSRWQIADSKPSAES